MSENKTSTDYPLKDSVDKLRRDMERVMEAVVEQGGRALDKFGLRTAGGPWLPAVDLVETADEVHVLVNLPGVDPDSVDLQVVGNMLTINGETSQCEAGEDETTHLSERGCGPFSRSLPMPVSVNSESVSAEVNQGVLTIKLSKAEHLKPRKIPVIVGGGE
jgi:HSP20 family protein